MIGKLAAEVNEAAWLLKKFEPFEVSPATLTEPTGKEVLVRVHAVAINPLDRLIQKMGGFLYGWLKYPAILGVDLAGEVVAVGPEVTRFKEGDRVLALAVGVEKSINRPEEGAFQRFATVLENLTAPIPSSLSYEEAAVLPLGISTAASGMFQRDFLGLNPPTSNPSANGKTLLVWGGSTSVGINAIQLAVCAGYEVVATASPKNFEALRKLGASHVFDYKSRTAVQEIKELLKGRSFAGAVAIGGGSAQACIDIAGSCTGKKFVAMATFPGDLDAVPERAEGFAVIRRVLPKALPAFVGLFLGAAVRGVKTKFIWGSSLKDNEVSKLIFEEFLPGALASGLYQAAPAPVVVGHGLGFVQAGVDRLKRGVSAQKVVISL